MKLVTAAQMRMLEERAVAAGTSLDALMDAAGLAVAQEAWLSLGVVAGRRILVLVGPGNNGGDGLVAARHLAEWEADVFVYLVAGRPEQEPRLASVRDAGMPIVDSAADADFAVFDDALDGAELVIDAILGTGRSRPIAGALAEVLRRVDDARSRPRPPQIVAVDVPTGVDADSGRVDPLAVTADLTVTLGLPKLGLYMLPGAEHAGRIQQVDIGLLRDAERDLPYELLSAAWVRERLPARPRGANKGTFGRVMVVAGSTDYVGAPRLCAEGAYRAGAGLVTIACAAQAQAAIAPALPEATYLMLDGASAFGADSALRVREALDGYDVLLIGPGLSQATGVREGVSDLLSHLPEGVRACVIDADGLNALAGWPGWETQLRRPAVLTPHPGEMARLLDTSVAAVQEDRLGVATRAAAEWQQVVVLKGAHTVIAAPDGRAAIASYANPLLATAGTGDVLAGAIAGLLAQGMPPFEAAAAAVHIGGVAAEEMAEMYGDRGMLAHELLAALPRAIRTVREGRRPPPAAFPPGFAGLMGAEG